MKPSAIFLFNWNIGDNFIFKAFVDAFCAAKAIAKSDVALVMHAGLEEFAQIALEPEGIRPCFVDTKQAGLLHQDKSNPGGYAQFVSATADSLNLNGKPYTYLIHVASLYEPSLFTYYDLAARLKADNKIYAHLLLGSERERTETATLLKQIETSGIYGRRFVFPGYDSAQKTNVHHLHTFAELLQNLAGEAAPPLRLPQLYFNDAANLLLTKNKYILAQLGSADMRRAYPAEKTGRLLLELLKSGHEIIISGKGEECLRQQQAIAAQLADNRADMAKLHFCVDRFDLAQVLLHVRHALFTISSDSGVANLAHGLNAKLLVLGWGRNLNVCFPYPPKFDAGNTRVLGLVSPDCRCNQYTGYGCRLNAPGIYYCIDMLEPEDILAAVRDWL